MNIADIEAAVAELTAAPFDPASFAPSLFAAYGAPPATVTRIREGAGNTSDLPDGALWRMQMHQLSRELSEIQKGHRLANSVTAKE
mgnify:CR=1|tara:strand:+ start:7063 stop:7320 length:258 start_codon:yes stop_codon:yes gene_type:complete